MRSQSVGVGMEPSHLPHLAPPSQNSAQPRGLFHTSVPAHPPLPGAPSLRGRGVGERSRGVGERSRGGLRWSRAAVKAF